MKITPTQYAETLYELTAEKSKHEIDGVIANFLKILVKSRKMKLAPEVIEKFSEIYNKKNGIAEAEVISREALSNELRNKVSSYVSNKYQAKEVVISNKVDESIKGGIIVKVEDEVMDGSVAKQLTELKNALIK
ncbi:MAG: ATP synthase F1 subunit delta [Candidatus Moranbacteria bacterium RIFCSPHIGHO2_02_FULL_40_12b]|nr:MAG: ATP synthase F1 subunit delta [Candidatus Moranbacteria bacterium RIFCSPHIGHO2_02_FULL_40_12b]